MSYIIYFDIFVCKQRNIYLPLEPSEIIDNCEVMICIRRLRKNSEHRKLKEKVKGIKRWDRLEPQTYNT